MWLVILGGGPWGRELLCLWTNQDCISFSQVSHCCGIVVCIDCCLMDWNSADCFVWNPSCGWDTVFFSFCWCCHHCQGEVINTFNHWWCVTGPNYAQRGGLLMAFWNAQGSLHVYLDQMAVGNSHCCSMTLQHLRKAIRMKCHSLLSKILKPFHDGASLGAAYVKSSACSSFAGNALPIYHTAWSLCLMNILGSLNKCFERKHCGMKVAETSALWELHNESIVWVILSIAVVLMWIRVIWGYNTHLGITSKTSLAFATSAGSCSWVCVFNWSFFACKQNIPVAVQYSARSSKPL